ncbi:MAG: hypothetical protein HRF40_09170 [Nitrososphaera sp.]|jgi:hypothetical protein
MVNLTMPQEIRAPVVVKLELSFFNATTRQLINNSTTVVYEIEYKGSPLHHHVTERYSGHTSTGTDVKYLVANQTGSLDIAVEITALNREAAAGGSFDRLDNPESAQFTAVVVPEFGPVFMGIVTAASLAAIVLVVKFKMFFGRLQKL